jgi:hypothetical protein
MSGVSESSSLKIVPRELAGHKSYFMGMQMVRLVYDITVPADNYIFFNGPERMGVQRKCTSAIWKLVTE